MLKIHLKINCVRFRGYIPAKIPFVCQIRRVKQKKKDFHLEGNVNILFETAKYSQLVDRSYDNKNRRHSSMEEFVLIEKHALH